jgi:hypothetical protein
MSIKASRFYGIGLALLGVVGFAACSSDEGTPTGSAGSNTGTAGTLGTAGTATGGTGVGTAGTGVGTAGTGVGTAGTATGGAGGGSSTACAGTLPASALITEFADLMPNPMSAGNYTFMLGVPGGTFAYQPGALTATTTGMALNVKGNIKAYDGFGVYTTACTNAGMYTGVSFNIKGNAGPTGMVNFRVQTNADMAVDTVNKKGSCVVPAGTVDTYPLCHPSSVDVPVTAAGAVVNVKFSELMGGVPVAAVDGKDIVGFEWAFAWMEAGTAYDADVTVDDLKFTGGTTGGTGTGGTGGSGGSGGSAAGTGGSGGSGGSAAGTGGNGGSGGN